MSYKYEASIKEAINIEYHTDFSGYMNRIKEIDRVYAQAAKADEYEAKAKAFDRIVDEINTAGATMHKKESLVQYAAINAFWNIDEIIVDYESGESDD